MRALESTFSKRDSALGKHSADFGGLEATADHQSSSAPKPPKNYESPTAKQAKRCERSEAGFFRTPRILEEEKSSLRGSGDSHNEAIHKDKSQKVDSSPNALFPSLRALHRKAWQSTSSKNIKTQKVDSRIFTQTAQPAHHDSRNCGGAVVALRFLGKVSELGVRAFHKNRNTAALPTQS